ncbi:hypothetical protein CHUAL_009758 [Chamberlinius hualienensis]
MESFCPTTIAKYAVKVKTEKVNDVRKLLVKHFGLQWESNSELVYYKNVFQHCNVASGSGEEKSDLCKPVDNFPALIV